MIDRRPPESSLAIFTSSVFAVTPFILNHFDRAKRGDRVLGGAALRGMAARLGGHPPSCP